MSRFEKRFGKYAIKNLTLVLIIGYAIGYLFQLLDNFRGTSFVSYLELDPWKIIHGQVWRIISWVLIPPSDYASISGFFFILLMMWCCLSIGTVLERTWGTFKYNVYIIGGILLTVVSSFVGMGILMVFPSLFGFDKEVAQILFQSGSVPWSVFSTFFINMSIYIGFAITYPNNIVRFMFFIPMRMKWLGIIDGAYFAYYLYLGVKYCLAGSIYSIYGLLLILSVLAALLNILLFWLINLRRRSFSPKDFIRREKYKKATRNAGPSASAARMHPDGSRHKCAICGQTDVSNPNLDFRYCSKCVGSFEYCQEHLFTHTHKG